LSYASAPSRPTNQKVYTCLPIPCNPSGDPIPTRNLAHFAINRQKRRPRHNNSGKRYCQHVPLHPIVGTNPVPVSPIVKGWPPAALSLPLVAAQSPQQRKLGFSSRDLLVFVAFCAHEVVGASLTLPCKVYAASDDVGSPRAIESLAPPARCHVALCTGGHDQSRRIRRRFLAP